ncbi:MAG: hypothetical protein SGPRY_013359, partial [Prymnesium sp.]
VSVTRVSRGGASGLGLAGGRFDSLVSVEMEAGREGREEASTSPHPSACDAGATVGQPRAFPKERWVPSARGARSARHAPHLVLVESQSEHTNVDMIVSQGELIDLQRGSQSLVRLRIEANPIADGNFPVRLANKGSPSCVHAALRKPLNGKQLLRLSIVNMQPRSVLVYSALLQVRRGKLSLNLQHVICHRHCCRRGRVG